MRLEFDFNQKDCLKRYQLLSNTRIRISQWLIVLLILCSMIQILLMWRELIWMQFLILSTGVLIFNAYVFARVFRRRRFPPYHCDIEFRDGYLYEKSNETEYQKAYAYLEGVEEDRDYLLIRHPGNVVLLPKRVIDSTQRDWLLNELTRRVATAPEIVVPFYEESFHQNKNDTFQFTWNQDDLKHMNAERFVPYDPRETLEASGKPRNVVVSRRFLTGLMFIPALGLLFSCIVKSSVLPLPLSVFLFGLVILNELAYSRQNRTRRMQTNRLMGMETEFYVSKDSVWIGEPGVVNRHALSDIVRVYYGDYFVALQSHESLLYILPKRAIGGQDRVLRFLSEVSNAVTAKERIETGNPYQSPTL